MVVIPEKPSLVVLPHALAADGRVSVVDAFLLNETLGAYIKRTGVIVPAGPVAVWHNGHRVPDALWRRLIPRTGDQVIIRARVLGGGGGNKIIASVLTIALVLAAPYMAGYALTGVWGVATGFAAAALTAGIMIGGTLLINALLPPPKPTMDGFTQKKFENSPTYSISGGRNQMRRWEPMTVIFGRHKVIPDLAAQPYTEYVGDNQFLNQAFHFGLQAGRVSLSDFRIGDTPITNFQGVRTQLSAPDGSLSMFPGNVDTIQGFVTSSADGWISRTTPVGTRHISVELASQLFHVNDDGGMASRSVEIHVQYRKPGGAWLDIGGRDTIYATHYWSGVAAFVANKGGFQELSGSNAPQLLRGSTNPGDHYQGERNLLYFPDSGLIIIEWRWTPHPHSLGQPWQGIAPDPAIGGGFTSLTITGAQQTPTRRTVAWDVPEGQYEVRVQKVTGDIKDSRSSNETAVGQILCYQNDKADYRGQLRMALRIKATNQLSGAIDQFSAIAFASCDVFEGGAWVSKPTRNPGWWFLHFARGVHDAAGRRAYGGGLADREIDIEAIKAWALWCDQKKLTFDYVLDRKVSTADMLQIIARAGRASPTWQSGKLGAVWDAANLPVVAMFGPFNMRAGSLKVAYINDGTADEIVLNYMNPDRGWTMDEVRVAVPGATSTNNPLQLDFEGCTDTAMAGREANLLAASQIWHRRRVTWETDIEGWVASRGDVVQLSHDLTVWGYSGRLMGRDGNTIGLDKYVPTGGTGILMIRGPENQMKIVSVVADMGDVDTLTITSDMTGFPLPGDEGYEDIETVDWAWFFDPLETPGRRFKITEATPSEDGVAFAAIDDDPGYYASENNPYQHAPPRDGALLSGVVFGIKFAETLVSVQADISSIQINWALSASVPVTVVIGINGISQPAIETMDRQISVQAQTGDVISVTITPKSSAAMSGTPSTAQYTVLGLAAPLPAVTGLTNVFRDGLTVLVWDRVVDIRQPEYEVRLGDSWDNSRTVVIVPTLETLAIGNGLYWVAARFHGRGHTVYGPPDSLRISGAVLVRNVLVTHDEHPIWPGMLSDGAIVYGDELTLAGSGDILDSLDILGLDDVLWHGGAQPYGTYEIPVPVDIGYDAPVRVDCEVKAYAVNFMQNVLSSPDILAEPDLLLGSDAQHYRITPQIRHAGEDGVYGPWRDYVPGLINARYFDIRLVLETDDPMIVPFVTDFTWTIDVPDLVQQGTEITIPAAGTRITYAKAFHVKPNVQIATFDATDRDRYELTNSTKTGFDIRLFNGDTAVQRQINWLSQGY